MLAIGMHKTHSSLYAHALMTRTQEKTQSVKLQAPFLFLFFRIQRCCFIRKKMPYTRSSLMRMYTKMVFKKYHNDRKLDQVKW